MSNVPTWYEPVDSLSARINLNDVLPGRVFPVREPSTQQYASVQRLFPKGEVPNFYEPAVVATVAIAYFDAGGTGSADWPAKDAAVEAWKKHLAPLPKTAADRIVLGCIKHFADRFEGNE